MATRFCENCGTPIVPGDAFCAACGQTVDPANAAVAAPPPAAPTQPPPAQAPAAAPPPPSQPAHPSQGTRKTGWIAIAAAIVLLALGGSWWYLSQPKTGTIPPTAQAAPPAQAPEADGADFLGVWFPEDPSGADEGENLVTFTRHGTQIVGVGRDSGDGRIVLTVAPGPKLSGEAIEGDGSSTPVTAEILADKKKMILTFAPPASEYYSVVMWRMNDEEAAQAAAPEPVPEPVSEERARTLVAAQGEVARFAKELQAQGKNLHIDVSPKDERTYLVHVYELVDDGDGMGHTATFGWYEVDRSTGTISSGM